MLEEQTNVDYSVMEFIKELAGCVKIINETKDLDNLKQFSLDERLSWFYSDVDTLAKKYELPSPAGSDKRVLYGFIQVAYNNYTLTNTELGHEIRSFVYDCIYLTPFYFYSKYNCISNHVKCYLACKRIIDKNNLKDYLIGLLTLIK